MRLDTDDKKIPEQVREVLKTCGYAYQFTKQQYPFLVDHFETGEWVILAYAHKRYHKYLFFECCRITEEPVGKLIPMFLRISC